MISSTKKVLLIDLTNKAVNVKSYGDLNKYIGGIGVGLKLLQNDEDKDPIVFSIGPLNGYFPFASKTSVITTNEGNVEDLYIGGSLSSRIKFTGLDAISITGKSEEPVIIDIQNETVELRPATVELRSLGLPGKRSLLAFAPDLHKESQQKLYVDHYFTTSEQILENKFREKNIQAICVTGTQTYQVGNKENYEAIYNQILGKQNEVIIEKSTHPSCVGCPLGCAGSQVGELGGNVLIHSLVACTYAENLFADIGIVFSCLNVLGYDYTHEDLELLPKLIDQLLAKYS